MKAQIFISGQLHGNFLLRNHLSCYNVRNGMFNSFYLYYDSVKEAKKAIKDAYWSIRNTLDPGNYHVVYKSKDNSYLSYDASTAKVIKEKSLVKWK